MISYTDKEYKATKMIKQGKVSVKPDFQPLANWIGIKYGVKPINIIYDFIDNDSTSKNRTPRLGIIFEYEKDTKQFYASSFGFDKGKQADIVKEFKQTLVDQELNVKRKIFYFWSDGKTGYDIDNVWVYFTAFDKIAKQEANSHISQEVIENYMENISNPDVWNVMSGFSSAYVFMYTDSQVNESIENGFKNILSKMYLDLLKPYDEFDYFKEEEFSIILDSKENFDTNYESNWFYYFK